MKKFIPYSFISSSQHAAAREIFANVRERNAFRNTLAHGLYLSDEVGTRVELLSYAVSMSRKPKRRPLTGELLTFEIDQIFLVRDRIRDTFFPEFAGADRPGHIR